MKKKYSPLAMALLGVLVVFNHIQVIAQKKVTGSGNVTVVDYEVDSFSSLELDGVFHVYIRQGEQEKVEVETDDNLHQYVIVENRGKKLVIDTQNKVNFRKKKRMNIFVTIRDIERLEIAGVGNVESEGRLELNDLELRIKSVGKVNLELVADYLEADINSVGNVTLAGRIKKADIENGGVGRLAAYDLENKVLDLRASGVGKTEVYASQEIAIKSTGVGSVFYKGDAVVTKLNVRGVGKVKKR
ncbi:MAG: head GIN domain-containing protein [Bacteroidota bacterium]